MITSIALRREIWFVVGMTLIGAVLRLWSAGQLGLVHFDEGIYAAAGLWSVSPHGLSSFDPMVVSYAPGGYPFLVGLSYWLCGVGDLSAILVSAIMGIMT